MRLETSPVCFISSSALSLNAVRTQKHPEKRINRVKEIRNEEEVFCKGVEEFYLP